MDAFSLMYHDVVGLDAHEPSGFGGADAASYKIDAHLFDEHLAAITRAVDSAELDRVSTPRQLSWRQPSRPAAVALHFDDGGASALATADRLERCGWRAFFHITTDRIGSPGFVTAADVRELHHRGHMIGTHSCSHPVQMSRLPPYELLREWTASKATLEGIIGAPVTVASVPGGFCSHRVVRAADQAGIEILFTSEPTSSFDWMLGCLVLGRYAIRSTTPAETAARLATGAALPRWQQWATWNAKKVLKRVGGTHWFAMRSQLFHWRASR